MSNIGSPYYNYAEMISQRIYSDLGKYISPDLVYAQLRWETGDFASELSAYNNFAGLTTTVDTGLPLPESENAKGVYYQKFDTVDDFFNEYLLNLEAYLRDSPATNIGVQEFIDALQPPVGKQYFTGSKKDYRDGLLAKMSGGAFAISPQKPVIPWGGDENTAIPSDSYFGASSTFGDRFYNAWIDNGAPAWFRTMWTNIEEASTMKDLPLMSDYTPSEEDMKIVQDALPGNITAQSYVLENASSQKALLALVRLKQEDIEREDRINRSEYGIATLGTIAGSFLDPINIASMAVSGGAFGIGAKAMSMINKYAKARAALTLGTKTYNKSRAVRYAVGALTGAGTQFASRYAAQQYGGFEANYLPAMALGGLFSGISAMYSVKPPLVKSGGQKLLSGSTPVPQLEASEKVITDQNRLLNKSNIIYGDPAVKDRAVTPTSPKEILDKLENDALRGAEGLHSAQDHAYKIGKFLYNSSTYSGARNTAQGKLEIPIREVTPNDVFREMNLQRSVNPEDYTVIMKEFNKDFKYNKGKLWQALRDYKKSLPETQSEEQKIANTIQYAMTQYGEEFAKTKAGRAITRYNRKMSKRGQDVPTKTLEQTLREMNNTPDFKIGTVAQKLLENGNIAFIYRSDAETILREYGITLKKGAKAFTIPGTDISVLIREEVTPENLRGLITHEVGVHQGLKGMLDNNAYEALMRKVEDRMQHSKSKEWRNAARMASNTEEALAYWIEQMAGKATKTSLFKQIKNNLNRKFRGDDDEDIIEIIQKSIDFQMNKKPGVKVYQLADGIEVDGVKYGNNNAFKTIFDEFTGEAVQVRTTPSYNKTSGLIDETGARPKPEKTNRVNPNTARDDINYTDIEYSEKVEQKTIFDDISDKYMSSDERQKSLIFHPFGLNVAIPPSVGRLFEAGRLFATVQGTLVNSRNPIIRNACNLLFPDPRMLESQSMEMPVAELKETIKDKFNIEWVKLSDMRADYINKTTRWYGRGNNRIRAVNKQIIDCYNAMHNHNSNYNVDDFPVEIQEMAKQIGVIREKVLTEAQKTSHQFGIGLKEEAGKALVDPDWVNNVEEFYRVIDDAKFTEFYTRFFNDKDKLLEFMKNYAKEHINVAEMTRRYRRDLQKAKKAYEEEHAKYKNPKPFEETKAFKTYEQYLEENCRDWAFGIFDKDMSNLNYNGGVKKNIGFWDEKNSLTRFNKRLPIDTSGESFIPGTQIKFSFDKDLRNYDMDMYLPQILERSAGEIALNAGLRGKSITQFLDELRQSLEKERNLVGDDIYNREKDALSIGICKILNTGRYNLYRETRLDAFSNLIRTSAYANVGGNMSWAQGGEFGTMIAMGGWKTLTSCIPGIGKTLRKMRVGSHGAEVVEKVNRQLFAEDLATRAWDMTSSTESTIFRATEGLRSEIDARPSVKGQILDSLASNIKRTALITSKINMLPKLTDKMVNSMRQSVIEDSLSWAQGKKFSSWRNPFSNKKLAAVGIKDPKIVDNIKSDINKYLLERNGDIESWCADNPTTYYAWKRLIDYQSHRGIQQLSVGNSNIFKEKHPIICQFKDFAFRAINGQTLRALSSREKDDLLAALYSMGTNCLTYAGLTYARAAAMYPDDERKQRKFLEKQLSPERLALAAFTRGALTGSILSFGMDGYEVLTGNPMFRTTVDNTYRMDYNNSSRYGRDKRAVTNSGITDILGNAVRQLPAVNNLSNIVLGGYSGYRLANGSGTTKDWDQLIRSLPLGSWVGMTYLSSYAKDDLRIRKEK